MVRDSILASLRIKIEKLILDRPDYVILVTHSPPYGIADESTPITLRGMEFPEEYLADTIIMRGDDWRRCKEAPYQTLED